MAEGKKNLVVNIDEELHQRLKIYCVEQKASIKEIVIKIISEKLDQEQERKK